MPGTLKLAGQLLVVSGILHCLAWILGGSSGETARFVVIGLAYVLIGAGLFFRVPKIRYLAFLIVLIGVVGDYIALGAGMVAVWFAYLMLLIDLAVLAMLIASIWRGRQTA